MTPKEMIESPWSIGFKDRGFGFGDFAVMVDEMPIVIAECPNREVAEHIIELHNHAQLRSD